MAERTHVPRSVHSAAPANARSVIWPAVMPYERGRQPLPQDAKKLRRELTRLNWAIHCLHGQRAKTVVVLARQDAKLAALRRERDEYACALQDMDPAAYEAAESERRDYDDPIKALKWAMRPGGADDVL